MTDKYLKNYNAALEEDAPRIIAHAERHQEEYQEYCCRFDEKIVGKLLKCHLIIEHYLTDYLTVANPGIGDIESCRLTFEQKLKLACSKTTNFFMFENGLRRINKVRNRLVHRVDHSFVSEDLRDLLPIFNYRYKSHGIPIPEGIELIEEFTDLACQTLSGFIDEIQHKCPNEGIGGLRKWWEDRMNRS